jgi:hypothetical protein
MVGATNPVRFRFFAYDPLSFVTCLDYPHDLPAYGYLKHLPSFAGKFGVSTKDHFANFFKVVDDYDVKHDDACADHRGGCTNMVQIHSRHFN